MLWLVKIWQVSSCKKFMQHLETCLLWQVSFQSFVSTCYLFNCLLPLDVQNEIQLLSRVFCYSWLVCLLFFWLRDTSLVQGRRKDFSKGGSQQGHHPGIADYVWYVCMVWYVWFIPLYGMVPLYGLYYVWYVWFIPLLSPVYQRAQSYYRGMKAHIN